MVRRERDRKGKGEEEEHKWKGERGGANLSGAIDIPPQCHSSDTAPPRLFRRTHTTVKTSLAFPTTSISGESAMDCPPHGE